MTYPLNQTQLWNIVVPAVVVVWVRDSNGVLNDEWHHPYEFGGEFTLRWTMVFVVGNNKYESIQKMVPFE